MLDKIIRLALENRLIVVIASLLILLIGAYVTVRMPVDVLPDLTAPSVTIMTEAKGMAPEEVETFITYPIESNLNGATGVRRVRSSSTPGLSTVWVEFTWGTDIYRARQVVNEKLQLVGATLPGGTLPMLAPISSIMGEIMYVAVTSDRHNLKELKETADFVVRKRLLAVAGVAQVVPIGGESKQYVVEADLQKLAAFGVSVNEVLAAVKGSNENFAAGVMKEQGQDYLIRGVGRVQSPADFENSVVSARSGVPVMVRDVATVKVGSAFHVGDASVDLKPAILVAIQKHPDANTVELTRRVAGKLEELKKTLPAGMTVDTNIFRQSNFIELALKNIQKVLVEGAVLVCIILFLFLGNMRTTFIFISHHT